MRKLIITGMLVATLVSVVALAAAPAGAKPRGSNGRIAFTRFDPALGDTVDYTINPDGTHEQQLFSPTVTAGFPNWSPDGSRIATSCCNLAAFIINPDTGSNVELPMTDPDLLTFCNVWSPDGARLACEAGFVDPSRQGIYTIRSSDGGGLTQITSNPGGDDAPGSYSPDGKRLVFIRANPDGIQALETVKLDGTGLRQITPTGMFPDFGGGDWSPQGNEIVFASRVSTSLHSTIWLVHSDGSGLHQLSISGCGGVIADPTSTRCFSPAWSPDGQKIVFAKYTTATGQQNLYTVNTDGTGLFQVTHGGADGAATSWGTHPLAH